MQDKIDKLTDIIKCIKSAGQKNYALTLLADLVGTLNGQSKEIHALHAYKTNNKISEIDCELEKYILLLIYYGFTQKYINIIRRECVLFVAKNRKEIDIKEPSEIKLIDDMLMIYELEYGKQPDNYKQLIEYCK